MKSYEINGQPVTEEEWTELFSSVPKLVELFAALEPGEQFTMTFKEES